MQYFTGNFGTLGTLFLVLLLTLLMAASASAKFENGKGGGNAGGGNNDSGPECLAFDYIDPVLEVNATSTSLNFDDIIFQDTKVDLNGFGVCGPSDCTDFTLLDEMLDLTQGTLVLGPRNEVADSAKLIFWFKGKLSGDDGKVVQYFLSMEGGMSPADNWPPGTCHSPVNRPRLLAGDGDGPRLVGINRITGTGTVLALCFLVFGADFPRVEFNFDRKAIRRRPVAGSIKLAFHREEVHHGVAVVFQFGQKRGGHDRDIRQLI